MDCPGLMKRGWEARERRGGDPSGKGKAGPQNAPGQKYEYSDVGSATLGAVVAQVSGMPVERFIETRIPHISKAGIPTGNDGGSPHRPG